MDAEWLLYFVYALWCSCGLGSNETRRFGLAMMAMHGLRSHQFPALCTLTICTSTTSVYGCTSGAFFLKCMFGFHILASTTSPPPPSLPPSLPPSTHYTGNHGATPPALLCTTTASSRNSRRATSKNSLNPSQMGSASCPAAPTRLLPSFPPCLGLPTRTPPHHHPDHQPRPLQSRHAPPASCRPLLLPRPWPVSMPENRCL